MKILIMSQWFDPEPTIKGSVFTRELVKGLDVVVITGFPNYPNGKLYPGYKLKFSRKKKFMALPFIECPYCQAIIRICF